MRKSSFYQQNFDDKPPLVVCRVQKEIKINKSTYAHHLSHIDKEVLLLHSKLFRNPFSLKRC